MTERASQSQDDSVRLLLMLLARPAGVKRPD